LIDEQQMFYRIEAPSLGIREIDDQHRQLIGCFDRLVMWGGRGRDFPALLDTLRGLASGLEHHFRYEEAFLVAHGFPEMLEHAEAHRRIGAAVAALLDQVNAGEPTSRAMIDGLRCDFVDHICDEDRVYAAFLGEQRDVPGTLPQPAMVGSARSS
jgi:hemerythrin-like metal-binding protein